MKHCSFHTGFAADSGCLRSDTVMLCVSYCFQGM